MSEELLQELLDRLTQGDTEAATQVFLAYEPYLRKVIRRHLPARLRSKVDSSDVMQSAWSDVLERLRTADWSFESPAQLQAFLVRVMKNRCIDRFRRYRRPLEQERSLGETQLEDMPASPSNPEAIAQANELWDRLLALCPPQHHEVLRLKREGVALAEIARQTGLHEDSIRRILRELARRLACASPDQQQP
jgi:RNA polymerase sigma-70 factor (ECF subfamily)